MVWDITTYRFFPKRRHWKWTRKKTTNGKWGITFSIFSFFPISFFSRSFLSFFCLTITQMGSTFLHITAVRRPYEREGKCKRILASFLEMIKLYRGHIDVETNNNVCVHITFYLPFFSLSSLSSLPPFPFLPFFLTYLSIFFFIILSSLDTMPSLLLLEVVTLRLQRCW